MTIKSLIITLAAGCVTLSSTAQNVGIGTSSPTRAKLEVNGMVGNTTAIFGAAGNGMGLVASFPTVEFNGYYNGGLRYLNPGYLANTYMDVNTGTMGLFVYASGAVGALATAERPGITIASNGRVSIGDNPGLGFNAQLNVGKDADKDASAWFAAPQWSTFNYTSAEHTYIRAGTNGARLFLNNQPQNSKIVLGNGSSNVGINWTPPVYPLEIHQSSYGIGLMRLSSQNNWLISVYNPSLRLFFRTTPTNNFPT